MDRELIVIIRSLRASTFEGMQGLCMSRVGADWSCHEIKCNSCWLATSRISSLYAVKYIYQIDKTLEVL